MRINCLDVYSYLNWYFEFERVRLLPGNFAGTTAGTYIYSDWKAHCNPFSSFVNCKSCDCERSHPPRRRSLVLTIEPCASYDLPFQQQAPTTVREDFLNQPSNELV